MEQTAGMERRAFLGVLLAVALGPRSLAAAPAAVDDTAEVEALVAWARKPGRTVEEVLERTLPGMSPADREYFLWEETGFPCFFASGDPIGELVRQLVDVQRRLS